MRQVLRLWPSLAEHGSGRLSRWVTCDHDGTQIDDNIPLEKRFTCGYRSLFSSIFRFIICYMVLQPYSLPELR
jgi:hypothetical protein